MTILHGRVSCSTLLMTQAVQLFYGMALLFMIITLQSHICKAVQHSKCHHNFNYTTDSTYERNLNSVMTRLIKDSSHTGFNTSGNGQVYGLVQCRGDTTPDQCYNCSQQANTTLRQNCGNAGGGLMWFDFCFLRYENYSFFGQLDTTDNWYIWNAYNVSASPDVFIKAVNSLFNKLVDEATSGSTLYASGTTTDSLSRKIYGLVQCTRDMSIDSCTSCLQQAINYIFTVYSRREGARGLVGSCTVRYEIYSFFNSTSSPPPNSPVADTPPNQTTPSSNSTQNNKSSNNLPIILGVAGGLLLLLLVCVLTTRRRLKSIIFRNPSEGNLRNACEIQVKQIQFFCLPLYIYDEAVYFRYIDHGEVEEDTLIGQDRQIAFTMEQLIAATENFHDKNKLGEGGFGAVYKGTIEDGKEIAVKKLSLRSMQGKREFMNEVNLVAKIQHRNLVNLLGCCAEGSERLLVYEYLPNKSLDKILFDPNKRNQLDWQKRYNIIVGVARGLLYLHEDSQLRIIHRDIKASNILLDENLNPKIADFGLARLFPEDESHVSTRVAGTYGYMAPEYAMQGQLSVKADVYSFGVLLLELITGRKNNDNNLSLDMQTLLKWAWRLYKRGNIVEIIDPAIIVTCNVEEALRCIHVGLLCTQADSSLRPLMSLITLMLSSHSVTLADPTQPAFVSENSTGCGPGVSQSASISSPSSAASHAPPSNADASITELVPRRFPRRYYQGSNGRGYVTLFPFRSSVLSYML
eukprot:PITA_07409